MIDHARIASAFAHARDYDGQARVQRDVAEALADRIAALPLPPQPRVLEFGCGTGFLTQALIARGIGGRWQVTDLAPAMVERCKARVGEGPERRFATLDGEYGAPADAPFDLVCSSLALQWFDDGPAALARMAGWLAPGGHCLVTTLGAGTFPEWRAAHAAEGLKAGTPTFPTIGAFAALSGVTVTTALHAERHADARGFLHALKDIGAGTARGNHRPLPPAALRRVMRRFEAAGAIATYEVVTCHLQRAT
ncbi:methyltransferase domain-containing protein [Novosphingobium colocasiae]|uniref:Methyltransferase domain-containing protein n=1 Tax=Novosphingobium colocasiae TaxID=1256513 RepID=A0A918PER0_9SPHN|nr:methyltransferase domain-containing protein [Novosphingobium colocasiae]GGZ04501.1 hypothetical protein GCM10011614_19140 [Novosphingobium colocasiae]